ncbi:hypothetical protein QFC24_002796 [Naganishia onofrii]|uniref:Uncharacterized protein n=1 Tax=Naganishia onofrii TaxID=1851511 RepID=A0ACC2XLM2_9TREE|nr:hypothetical protein QFC24_002796 [Naganishia onofrii]
MSRNTLYYGSFVHSTSLTQLEYLVDTLVYVSDGSIVWIETDVHTSQLQDVTAKHGLDLEGLATTHGTDFVQLDERDFICPGLIDTHTHAPQYPNLGLGQEYELLDWLQYLTFPREAKFTDLEYAEKVYDQVVKRNLNAGTTTCSYYASQHVSSARVLADVVLERGQRALVGKCNMNRNCPDYYCEASPEASVEDTRALISYIRDLQPSKLPWKSANSSPLVQAVITPRFALSCTSDLMQGLGELMDSEPDVHIQTHLSENRTEIQETLRSFPECKSYTEVYEKYGMLRNGTILAHCVWLTEQEMDVIKRTGAGISHCPTSNFNLMSGGARVGAMLDKGLNVGLGSDCSGGFALGVLPQLRNASMLSKMLAIQPEKPHGQVNGQAGQFTDKPLSIPTLFYLATMGGAALCKMADTVGNFLPGKEFDALHVTPGTSPNFFLDVGEAKPIGQTRDERRTKLKETFERFLFVSDDRDIAHVYVRGRKVGGAKQ